MTDTSEQTGTTDTSDATDAATTDPATTGDAAGASDTSDTGNAGSGPDPRLLEELDQHIREVRAAAEEAMGDPEQTFVESGDEQSESQDDQTIAPPG
jgi:hypothetical protein